MDERYVEIILQRWSQKLKCLEKNPTICSTMTSLTGIAQICEAG